VNRSFTELFIDDIHSGGYDIGTCNDNCNNL